MLTVPILSLDKPYRRALDLSARKSRCVKPPSASEIHISFPIGGRSMLDINTSSVEKISRETPEEKQRLRIVQSYALVYTWGRDH
jgi:hypothetical protein